MSLIKSDQCPNCSYDNVSHAAGNYTKLQLLAIACSPRGECLDLCPQCETPMMIKITSANVVYDFYYPQQDEEPNNEGGGGI